MKLYQNHVSAKFVKSVKLCAILIFFHNKYLPATYTSVLRRFDSIKGY